MKTFCIAFYESYLSTNIQDGHVLPHLQRGARDLLAAGSVSQFIPFKMSFYLLFEFPKACNHEKKLPIIACIKIYLSLYIVEL
jgi:hypothetical protein